uniref:Peptidase S1 domain-containing protein n=1 Tax=Steinernema glaseri TaxID=37863 RepID=A0A1I7Z8N7_9BILA
MDTVKPIKISATDRVSDFPDQNPFIISGFGYTASHHHIQWGLEHVTSTSPMLRSWIGGLATSFGIFLHCDLFTDNDFRQTWETEGKVTIAEDKMCTSKRNAGTLDGDSGGPLVHTQPHRGEWRLVGLASFGSDDNAYPDVYTRVSKHCVWIADTTHMNVICSLY